MVEVVDTPTGQVLHLSRFPATYGGTGRTYCSATYAFDAVVAHPYQPEKYWKDAGKPPCSRCLYNFRLEQARQARALAVYGFKR